MSGKDKNKATEFTIDLQRHADYFVGGHGDVTYSLGKYIASANSTLTVSKGEDGHRHDNAVLRDRQ